MQFEHDAARRRIEWLKAMPSGWSSIDVLRAELEACDMLYGGLSVEQQATYDMLGDA